MNERDSLIRDAIQLSLIPGIGTVIQNRLWALCRGDISAIFSAASQMLDSPEFSRDACDALSTRRYQATAQEIFDWGKREGCSFLVRGQPGYPPLLEEIYNPPVLLYARGCLDTLESPCVSIVGTRKPTLYGLQMAQGLAGDLGSRGIAIVSGLARGIDAAAHRGCLDASGKTVAVLGCGIDIVYPREHRRMTEKIAEKGLLLSEFVPGTSPSPQNFPVRNRVISGLSLGTIIVEASEYSGSLITARLAMEQNREIFALPGNLTVPQSFGPNFLIKQGAKLVQSWRDVVEELQPDLRHDILAKEDTQPERNLELDLLGEEEMRILAILETDRTTQFDKIFCSTGLDISRLTGLLLDLEMKNRIRQVPGNMYVKVARPLHE